MAACTQGAAAQKYDTPVLRAPHANLPCSLAAQDVGQGGMTGPTHMLTGPPWCSAAMLLFRLLRARDGQAEGALH